MYVTNKRPGQIYQTFKQRVMNRTGGTVAVGDVLVLDVNAADAATQAGDGVYSTSLDVQDAVFQNAIKAAGTGGDDNRRGQHVVVTDVLGGGGADNTEIEVTLSSQRVQAYVSGTVTVGLPLTVNSSETTLNPATTGAHRVVAIALESGGTSKELIDVHFNGFPFCGGYVS